MEQREQTFDPMLIVAWVFSVVTVLWSAIWASAALAIPTLAAATTVLSPVLVGVLVTVAIFRKRISESRPSPVPKRQWRAHTILGIGAALLFSVLVLIFRGGQLSLDTWSANAAMLGVVVLSLIRIAVEEYALRGVMQPALEKSMPRVVAAAALGLVWGIGQAIITVTAMPSPVDLGVALGATSALIVESIALSILLGYLGNGSLWQRVSTTVIVRGVMLLLMSFIVGGPSPIVARMLAAVIVTVVFMIMFVVATRRRAARAQGSQA